jgi:integrase
MFDLHVAKAHPATAAMPANAVTARDVVALLRTLTEAGKGRTAAKLRSYLRAAYALATRAALDSDAPAAFLPFAVEANPVQDTGALSRYTRALDRNLSDPELREYHQAVKDQSDSPIRDALLLALLLGGQRPAQLLRATVADVDTSAKLLTLRDPKGKRTQPRIHVLPLTDAALEVVNRCLERVKKQQEKRGDAKQTLHLFSTHGNAPLRPETLTGAINEIATTLLAKPKAERVIVAPFQLRDLRRTCESRLAGIGISRDLRAQIQSHGLGGIQARHYDRHDYMDEKRAALVAWCAHLETKPADNVRQLHGGRRRVSRR